MYTLTLVFRWVIDTSNGGGFSNPQKQQNNKMQQTKKSRLNT